MIRALARRVFPIVVFLSLAGAGVAGAAAIVSGETRGGSLGSANGYEESWTFSGATGDRVLITAAQYYTTAIQPEIYLYQDGLAEAIAAAKGSNSSCRLDWQLPADGTYTITIRDFGLNGVGPYTIAFANLSGTLTSATDGDGGAIASGQTVIGSIYGLADVDLFQFEGAAGDRVIITLDGNEPQPELYLFPPEGHPLETSHVGSLGTRRLEWRLLESGTYTIAVSDWGLNTDGGYTLALAKIPGAATSAADGDGGAIASGETRYGTLSPIIDTDLFQFAGSAGERVVITTANLSGGAQPDILLYPPGGQPLEVSSLGGVSGHLLEWELQQSGTYTILVSDNGLNGEGTYSISLAKIPGAATSPGDADGGIIASGETKYGYLANRSDTDIFQFEGTAGDLVILTAAVNGSGVQPVLRVYPPGGPAEVSAQEGLNSQWLQFTLLQSGTYTVVVNDHNLDGSGAYNIALAKIPGAVTSAADPDGGTLVSGASKAGSLSYADTDLFLFYGTAGSTIVVYAATTSTTVQPELRLFSPSITLEQSSAATARSVQESWQLMETGVYTLLVSEAGLNGAALYSLSLVQIPGGVSPADDASDNDGGLLLHAETKVGALHHQADQDVYQFYGRPGERITLTAAPYSSSTQPELTLYPPGGGAPEKSATGALMPQKLRHTLLRGGLYTVVVNDNNLDSTGYYSLLFSTSAASPAPGIYGSFPPQGSSTVATEASFRWDAVPKATGYDFYYGTDPLQPLQLLGTATGVSRPFPERLVGKPYYWQVVARTPAGPVAGPLSWFKFMKSAVVHRDDFTDGNDSGDPDWLPYRYASWHVNAAKQFRSTATVDNRVFYRDFGGYLTGSVQARVMLTGSASAANASFLFAYQGDHQRYRYVKLLPGRIIVGQTGSLGGQVGGVKKTILVPALVGKWHTLRADLDSLGNVKVYLDGRVKGSFKFRKAVPGWLGFGADRVESLFDNFFCKEATVFP